MSVQEPTAAENNRHSDVDTSPTGSNLKSDSKRTPLPKLQLFILFLTLFLEPITALVIYPFINQFVQETGVTQGDERKIGYYAGIIESVFFLAECSTAVMWGFLSDRFGRRSALLLGPLGLAFSMLSFGSSTTYALLLISRSCQGLFNGYIGVTRSMMAEMTDDSNIGDVLAFDPLMWSTGSTFGPLIGGVFSNPASRWPDTLGRLQFLRVHPYFLPCAISASMAFATFIIAALALKETLPSLVAKKRKGNGVSPRGTSIPDATGTTVETPLINHEESLCYGTTSVEVQPSTSESTTTIPTDKPVLFDRGLIMIYLNFASLSFLSMGHATLMPLFYATSIPLGGVGLDPYQIGIILGSFGCVNSILHAKFLGSSIRKFGARKVYIFSFRGVFACVTLFPIIRYFAQRFGRVNNLVVFCMIVQLGFRMLTSTSFGSVAVILAQHVSESGRIGTAMSIAQMCNAGVRSIAPALFSSLYSISLQRQLAGGNLVFYIMMGLNLLAMCLSHFLPLRIISNSGQGSQ